MIYKHINKYLQIYYHTLLYDTYTQLKFTIIKKENILIRYVLTALLKLEMVLEFRNAYGIKFHSLGAWTANAPRGRSSWLKNSLMSASWLCNTRYKWLNRLKLLWGTAIFFSCFEVSFLWFLVKRGILFFFLLDCELTLHWAILGNILDVILILFVTEFVKCLDWFNHTGICTVPAIKSD